LKKANLVRCRAVWRAKRAASDRPLDSLASSLRSNPTNQYSSDDDDNNDNGDVIIIINIYVCTGILVTHTKSQQSSVE
jgi:hypothetical protein